MENNQSTTTADTREALVKDVGQLKQNATQIAKDVKAHANAHVDQARQKFNETMATIQATLAQRPLAILGAGLMLGYILGARRRRSRS